MVTLTPEEQAWALKDRPKLGDMIDELNERARQYVNFSSMSVPQAQKKALEDFKGFFATGEYVAVKVVTDKAGPYFWKVGDEPQ